MPLKAHYAKTLPKPRFRYTPCIQAGPYYQLAGMIALDAQSGQLESGGVAAETDKIMRNMLGALPEYGLSLDQLVIARIFTTRFDQFAEINRVWESYFPEGTTPPARTAMGVAALPLNASVEIEFCFYREE